MSESENSAQDIHEPVAFGHQLMLARERAGMSIEEAARALKLKEKTVKAIEDSDLDKLPPVAFVKGYVRTYARLLGMSEERIIREFEHEIPHALESELHPRSVLPGEADSQTPVIRLISAALIVSAVVVLIYAVYSYYSEKTEQIEQAGVPEELESPISPQIENVLEDLPIETAWPEVAETGVGALESRDSEAGDVWSTETAASEVEASESDQTATATDHETAILPQKEVAPVIAEQITAEVPSEAVEEPMIPVPTVTPITGGDVLAVAAEQECWAEIVDASDIRLFYGMIKPGRDLSLTGQAPFDIFLGNAPVVSLSLNQINIDMTKYIRSNNIAQFKVSAEDGRVRFH